MIITKRSVKDCRKPKFIGERIRGFFDLMRPFTLLGGLTAGFFLTMLGAKVYGVPFDFSLALFVGVILGLLQGASQTLNQSIQEELEIDKISGKAKYRPTGRGIISLNEGKIFATILYVAAIACAFFIKPLFGVFTSIIAFFGVFYTIPPIRAKRFFLVNNMWQGIARGMLPIFAVFSIFGNPFTSFSIALASVIGMWMVGAQASKDYGSDIKGDSLYGIQTFFVRLSENQAFELMGVFTGAAFILLIIFTWLNLLPHIFLLMLILIIPSFLILYFLKNNCVAPLLENNLGWISMYLTLALWYILPALIFYL
jgi:4-hydroxybenzoate polyprenyltransferase